MVVAQGLAEVRLEVVQAVVDNSNINNIETKNMLKKISYIIVLLFLANSLLAQNEMDALRYSQNFNGGTARYVGMGGAMGAIGGDLSTTYNNPAGVGVFRSSQFTVTPNLVFNSTSSEFLGESSNDYRTNFNINNIGVVSSLVDKRENSKLVAVNWAFSYNRTNNYHFNEDIIGVNNNNSITDYFADNSNGNSISDLNYYSERLAWETYSINSTDSINYIYESALPNYGELQRRSIKKKGYMGEGDISVGINIKNKFFWGGSIGIVWTRFYSDVYHYEQEDSANIDNFNYLLYEEHLSTKGTGINFKTGVIYRPFYFLRIGAAVHSPTFFTLNDYYYTFMEASFDDVGRNSVYSPDLYQKYSFNTPGKFLGSMALFINKFAVISFDYELTDYSWASYGNSYSVNPDYANRLIDNTFTIAHNFKVGAEYRYNFLSFRAGAAYYGSPFKSDIQDSYTTTYSAGLGFNFNEIFLDLAYLYQQNSVDYYMYTNSPKATITSNSNKFMMTLGFRF